MITILCLGVLKVQHYEQLGLPDYLVGVNVDKNNLTTLQYWRKSEQSLGRYKFADDQLPKPMMKCIIELGLLTGDIDLYSSILSPHLAHIITYFCHTKRLKSTVSLIQLSIMRKTGNLQDLFPADCGEMEK